MKINLLQASKEIQSSFVYDFYAVVSNARTLFAEGTVSTQARENFINNYSQFYYFWIYEGEPCQKEVVKTIANAVADKILCIESEITDNITYDAFRVNFTLLLARECDVDVDIFKIAVSMFPANLADQSASNLDDQPEQGQTDEISSQKESIAPEIQLGDLKVSQFSAFRIVNKNAKVTCDGTIQVMSPF